jgi:hypothetical protein
MGKMGRLTTTHQGSAHGLTCSTPDETRIEDKKPGNYSATMDWKQLPALMAKDREPSALFNRISVLAVALGLGPPRA